jgi:hypothetical protein
MRIVNLTPHTITIINHKGKMVVESTGLARVSTERTIVGHITAGSPGNPFLVPVYETLYGDVEGLPDPEGSTIYVVSGMVRAALSERMDVMAPGALVRDSEGRVIGCEGLTY